MKSLAVMLVALSLAGLTVAGCAEKKESTGAPPVLGLGPGESVPYEESSGPAPAAPPPGGSVTANNAQPVQPTGTIGGATSGSAATGTTVAAKPRTYTIKKDDTLYSIARKFYNGDASKWKTIWEANKEKIPHRDRLKIGTEIVIP